MLKNIIYPNRYADSVFLMLISRKVGESKELDDVSAMMATDNNKEILREGGFLDDTGLKAGPNDLLVCIAGSDENVLNAALEKLEGLMEGDNSGSKDSMSFLSEGEDDFRPRTQEKAAEQLSEANFVFISVPGEYAAREAGKAIENGRNVMLFSDNVTLEEERNLKKRASELGLVVMGPDCGTAIINGTALGFANVVPRGKIGVIAASGTGLQAFTVLVQRLGQGISQAIGTGGRDLSKDIGGLSMLTAIDALEADPETSVIALVSKPPHPDVAEKIFEKITTLSKKTVVSFLGRDTSSAEARGICTAATLEQAAALAVELLAETGGSGSNLVKNMEIEAANEVNTVHVNLFNGISSLEAFEEKYPGKYLRGLYSGGTLCDEAIFALKARAMHQIHANIAVEDEWRICMADGIKGNCLIDLGEDEFTVGVPHPMIDFHLRNSWIETAILDPETRILLLDVVLGYGSNSDPAGELIPVIEESRNRRRAAGNGEVFVIASVCGTPADPQDGIEQEQRLRDAGVVLLSTNARAADLCVRLVQGQFPSSELNTNRLLKLFRSPLKVICLGLASFAEEIKRQDVPVVHLDWRPPAGGDKKLIAILNRLDGISLG